jgi:glutaredoxin
MSNKVIIYSKPNCTYCVKAKNLVKTLGFEYEEKMFGKDFTSPEELFEAVGKQVRTMPQIIIDEKHIGGYNEYAYIIINADDYNINDDRL